MKTSEEFIHFIHIPKCAGTTFRQAVVEKIIRSDQILQPRGGLFEIRKIKRDFQYLVGHYPLGVEHFLPYHSPVRKRVKLRIAALREPLEQMVSFYYYHKQIGEQSPWAHGIKNSSVVEFYRNYKQLRNMQVRFIAGCLFTIKYSPLSLARGAYLFRTAKYNLKNKIDYCFLQDSADEDFAKFAQAYGVSYEPQRSEVTVTRKRPQVDSLSNSEVQELRLLNQCDCMLYSYAKHLKATCPAWPSLR